MAQYINKDALVAEINNCIDRCTIKKQSCPVNTQVEAICDNKIYTYKEILSFLDTLEVKEVDLEKEYDNEFFKDPVFGKLVNRNAGISIAKHFFELGLKAHKGEKL